MYSALLECTHYARWATYNHMPSVGQMTWCFRCDADRKVTDVIGPWRAVCYHCSRVDHHGMNRPPIMAKAQAHVMTHPAHVVRVWRYGMPDTTAVLVTVQRTGRQPSLF